VSEPPQPSFATKYRYIRINHTSCCEKILNNPRIDTNRQILKMSVLYTSRTEHNSRFCLIIWNLDSHLIPKLLQQSRPIFISNRITILIFNLKHQNVSTFSYLSRLYNFIQLNYISLCIVNVFWISGSQLYRWILE